MAELGYRTGYRCIDDLRFPGLAVMAVAADEGFHGLQIQDDACWQPADDSYVRYGAVGFVFTSGEYIDVRLDALRFGFYAPIHGIQHIWMR
jgi:hypothetical protein